MVRREASSWEEIDSISHALGVSLKAALKSAGLIVLALDDEAACGMVRLLSSLLVCLCWRWIVKIQPMAW